MSRLNMETLAGYTFDRKARDLYQGGFLVRMLGLAFVASILIFFVGMIAGKGAAAMAPALITAFLLGVGGFIRNCRLKVVCTSCDNPMEKSDHSPPRQHFQHITRAHRLVVGTDRGSGAVYMLSRTANWDPCESAINTYQVSAEYYLCHECQSYFCTGLLNQKYIGNRNELRIRLDNHGDMQRRRRSARSLIARRA